MFFRVTHVNDHAGIFQVICLEVQPFITVKESVRERFSCDPGAVSHTWAFISISNLFSLVSLDMAIVIQTTQINMLF